MAKSSIKQMKLKFFFFFFFWGGGGGGGGGTCYVMENGTTKPNTSMFIRTVSLLTSLIKYNKFRDFIWDFGKLPFPAHLGKYLIKIGKLRAKIHEIGKIKAIFGLGMTPIYGLKNGQIKSLKFYQH